MQIPKSTKAWTCKAGGDPRGPLSNLVELVERPLPRPQWGEVLIRMEAAPFNPSDEMYLRGEYGFHARPGDVPGFEGCGTVIAARGGPYAWWLRGKRVAFGGQDGNGTWSEYRVTGLYDCIPISKSLPITAAGTFIINPMTALGLMAMVKRHRARAFSMNAAGSALGTYILALSQQAGISFIGLVRRPESAEKLIHAGAKYVLVTTESSFDDRYEELCKQLGATVLLDAVAGNETAKLMNAMPDESLAIVYGQLSQEKKSEARVSFDPDGLVFRKQQVRGYWLTDELHGTIIPLHRARQISKHYKKDLFRIPELAQCSLSSLIDAAQSNNGKTIFVNEPPTKE